MSAVDCPTPWKDRHRSRHAAKQEAKSMKRRKGQQADIYLCECGGYHVAGRLVRRGRRR